MVLLSQRRWAPGTAHLALPACREVPACCWGRAGCLQNQAGPALADAPESQDGANNEAWATLNTAFCVSSLNNSSVSKISQGKTKDRSSCHLLPPVPSCLLNGVQLMWYKQRVACGRSGEWPGVHQRGQGPEAGLPHGRESRPPCQLLVGRNLGTLKLFVFCVCVWGRGVL